MSSVARRRSLFALHRTLSLCAATLWVVQALSGLILVFGWELDGWSLPGTSDVLDPAALSTTLERLDTSEPGRTVLFAHASGFRPEQIDVFVSVPGGGTNVIRVDGGGRVLRERPVDHDFLHIGLVPWATYIHEGLLLGGAGNVLLVLSGLLLTTNLVLGFRLARPRKGQWLRALLARPAGPSRLVAWHRAIGLWLVGPALILVLLGIAMASRDALRPLIQDSRAPPQKAVAAAEPLAAGVTIATALDTAFKLYPGATLTHLELPSASATWFEIRVRKPGELRRAFGMTTLYVSSRSGRVLANYDATQLPLRLRLWDALYPMHTGEIAGSPGRWFVELVGWLMIALMAIGITRAIVKAM